MFSNKCIILFASCLLFTTCVKRYTYDLANYHPTESADVGNNRQVLIIEAADQRPQIVKGEETRDWVGNMRGGIGKEIKVKTSDGRTLAIIMTNTLRKELSSMGFRCVIDTPGEGGDIPSLIGKHKLTRAIHLVIKNFFSDTHANIDVNRELVLTVYDGDGAVVAENKSEGVTTLEGSFLDPAQAAREKVPEFYHKTMQVIITGKPDVLKSLSE